MIRFVLANALLALVSVGAAAQQCSMQCLLQTSDVALHGSQHSSSNPCGCNFVKKTARGDLRSMTLPELRKGLG